MNIQQIDFSVDLLQALLWQHNNAPRITALMRLKNLWYQTNQEEFWTAWVRDVFDLRTANEFGLKVWSIILGIPLTMIFEPGQGVKFGFGEFNKNFNNGNFGTLGSVSAGLTADQARLLLQLRYFQLICRPTVPEINQFLAYVFRGQGNVFCKDTNDMQYVIYSFGFAPGSMLMKMLVYYDVLPRPAGVGVQIIVEGRPVFGFGDFNRNFNNGTFADDRS